MTIMMVKIPRERFLAKNSLVVAINAGGNQDLVAWLEDVNRAFEANNIQSDQRIAMVGAYLTRMPLYGEKPEGIIGLISTDKKIKLLTRRQKIGEAVDQYAADMVALFRRVSVGGNQYPNAMKVQIFVQGLRPDLALAVGLFMPGTLQAAIERAKLTTLMAELVVTLKNDNGFRGNSNRNRGTNSNNNPRSAVNKSERTRVHEGEEVPNRNRPTIDKKENDGEAEEVEAPEEKEEKDDYVHKGKRSRKDSNIKISRVLFKMDKEEKPTSIYCEAQVKGHRILLVLDSGSSGCVVSANFLKEVNIAIDLPFMVVMIGVHGEQKRPLGEVDEFPVTIGGKTISSCAVCELMIWDGRKKIRIPTEYCKSTNINERIKNKEKTIKAKKELEEDVSTSEEETESESSESDLDEEYEKEVLSNKPYLYWESQEDKGDFVW
ncbi:hypothetical protein C2G38_2217235 [Gigaspora rosea]|uniref:Aspartic peptidase domain-containing protein n=1 Tax=Gigaspora rosea TaxID=44941 RepID=A0A397U7Y2_9GLOM|nr:hypothetical protein C2G38_2217235 [Gigaspora rosea]